MKDVEEKVRLERLDIVSIAALVSALALIFAAAKWAGEVEARLDGFDERFVRLEKNVKDVRVEIDQVRVEIDQIRDEIDELPAKIISSLRENGFVIVRNDNPDTNPSNL